MTECQKCGKPSPICFCDFVELIPTKTRVLILQHPQEKKEDLATAKLLHSCLPNSTFVIGLSWSNIAKVLGKVEPKDWLVLYLGSSDIKSAESPLVLVDKKGKFLEDGQHFLKNIKGLVILDGTWSQAKTLWWRNPWLLKLRRGVLIPPQASLYGKLRKEPKKAALSTLESAAYALEVLERKPEIRTKLLAVFQKFLDQYKK